MQGVSLGRDKKESRENPGSRGRVEDRVWNHGEFVKEENRSVYKSEDSKWTEG